MRSNTGPKPYRSSELRALRATLDARWPLLPDDESLFWLRRYRDGRSPYSRVRSHAIRAQLDAIIALALDLGLTRSEIHLLSVDDAHPDNEYVLVLDETRRSARRSVDLTDSSRVMLTRWGDVRWFLGAQTRALWANTHAGPTAHLPMKTDTFNRLLHTYLGADWELRRLRATQFMRSTARVH